MRYKPVTWADCRCAFHDGGVVPEKYMTESAAKKFCGGGCCIACGPLFYWTRVLGKHESIFPWEKFHDLIEDKNMIILLPMGEES